MKGKRRKKVRREGGKEGGRRRGRRESTSIIKMKESDHYFIKK